jgi:hypothetical protein
VKTEFYGIYEIFSEGLNSFKIQTIFKWGFSFEFYNLNFRGNSNLGPKGKLCHLDLSISMPSFENFEQKKDHVLYIWTWSILTNWKTHDYMESNRPRPSLRPCQTPLPLPPSLYQPHCYSPHPTPSLASGWSEAREKFPLPHLTPHRSRSLPLLSSAPQCTVPPLPTTGRHQCESCWCAYNHRSSCPKIFLHEPSQGAPTRAQQRSSSSRSTVGRPPWSTSSSASTLASWWASLHHKPQIWFPASPYCPSTFPPLSCAAPHRKSDRPPSPLLLAPWPSTSPVLRLDAGPVWAMGRPDSAQSEQWTLFFSVEFYSIQFKYWISKIQMNFAWIVKLIKMHLLG